MKSVAAAVLPPATRLGATPEIESLDDVDAALVELAWINARESTLQADCEARVAQIQTDAQDRMYLEVEGHVLSFADRRAHLDQAVRVFCETNKTEILSDSGKKSRDLTHGTIGWRQTQLKIAPAPGTDTKRVLSLIDKAVELTKSIVSLLGRLKLFGLPLGSLIELKPSLSLTKAKDAYKQQKLTAANLKKLGLVAIEPHDEFYLEVAKLAVRTEATGDL